MDERQARHKTALANNIWVRANYSFELFVTGKPTRIKRRLNWLRRWVCMKWWF